jgi:hypothetical protein
MNMKYIYVALLALGFLSACNPDPIFSMISNEVKPKPPLIDGSPSKLVESGGSIYTANGRLWKYSNGRWSREGSYSNVFDIASGGSSLYILSVKGGDTAVYNAASGAKIENPTEFDVIQSLHGDSSGVYAGAMKTGSNRYAVLSLGGSSFTLRFETRSPLTGVADSHFATGNGVYTGNGGLVSGSSGYTVAGIIRTSRGIMAVTSNGSILEVGNNARAHSTGLAFTGGLAVYKRGGVELLLIGIKNSVYDMGYREMKLSGDDSFALSVPGDNPTESTVSNRDKYRATLAKCAVNSLRQITGEIGSDGLPVIFASTQKDGLWSYRNGEWNAEE